MRAVNIAELKDRLSYYLNEVKAGHEVVVRDRNNPIARIVPINRGTDADQELHALAAQGKLRLGEDEGYESFWKSFWKLPAPRVSAAQLRRALMLERDED